MNFVRRHLRPFALLAWMALAALVLVPTVSRALPLAQPGPAWAALCSSADAGGSDAATHIDHCPLCGLAAAAALPTSEPASWVAGADACFAAASGAPAPAPRLAWSRAQPRGPPAIAC